MGLVITVTTYSNCEWSLNHCTADAKPNTNCSIRVLWLRHAYDITQVVDGERGTNRDRNTKRHGLLYVSVRCDVLYRWYTIGTMTCRATQHHSQSRKCIFTF